VVFGFGIAPIVLYKQLTLIYGFRMMQFQIGYIASLQDYQAQQAQP
jgi:hypothetical protein